MSLWTSGWWRLIKSFRLCLCLVSSIVMSLYFNTTSKNVYAGVDHFHESVYPQPCCERGIKRNFKVLYLIILPHLLTMEKTLHFLKSILPYPFKIKIEIFTLKIKPRIDFSFLPPVTKERTRFTLFANNRPPSTCWVSGWVSTQQANQSRSWKGTYRLF